MPPSLSGQSHVDDLGLIIAEAGSNQAPDPGIAASTASRDGVRVLANRFVCKTVEHFENVTDPRVSQGANYLLIEMIFVTLCACIWDSDGWTNVERYGKTKIEWLRKYFPFENGIPFHVTFGRVFSRLDTVEFYAALQSWANDISGSLESKTIAIEGKTLRGSHGPAVRFAADPSLALPKLTNLGVMIRFVLADGRTHEFTVSLVSSHLTQKEPACEWP